MKESVEAQSDDDPENLLFWKDRELPKLFRDPIRFEKAPSSTGTRLTKIVYDEEPDGFVVVSADRAILTISNNPQRLIESSGWHEIIPWLNNPSETIDRFWKKFCIERAEQERIRSCWGTALLNSAEEMRVIHWAKQIYAINSVMDPKGGCEKRSYMGYSRDQMLEKVGYWVVKSIMDDHKAFWRMHRLVKDENAVEDPKGDQLSFKGRILDAFVKLIAADMTLPTKKAVRHTANLGDEQRDLEDASKAFSKLGLGELPEG